MKAIQQLHLAALIMMLVGCTNVQRPQSAVLPPPEEAIVTPSRSLEQLDSLLRARIARQDSGEVALAFLDLETGIRLGINEHTSMHAASTMKVPVMLELFRQAEQRRGPLLVDSVNIVNEFTSIADHSKYSLNASDDSETTLYRRLGQRESLRELIRLMIAQSSNLATNILMELARPADIQATLAEINGQDMVVRRGVEDGAAFQRGLNNTTTADGFLRTLEGIARCRVTSRPACAAMTEILTGQQFRDMIPAGLPAGTRVAHKSGWITRVRHDGGIIYPANRAPYVLVIMTRGIADTLIASRLGADLSRIVWNAVTAPTFALPDVAPSTRLAIEQHRRYRNPMLGERRFRQDDLLRALDPYTRAPIEREEVGRSAAGKPLYLYRYGTGPTRVLLWSQMHGNESTATMALADLARYLHESGSVRVRDWAEELTIGFLPMLNPDGADRFQRHNDLGIDVNRDARALATPEGRALKAVHEQFRPHFGFNLHDQNPRTRVGNTERLAAISLLAPPRDTSRADDDQMREAKQLAATLRRTLVPLVGGHITRYDDSFNPRAFGDLMQSWGTRTVLIESGGWHNDPEKQYLRTVNFVALLAALDAIADHSYRQTPVQLYASLPPNGRNANDVLIAGGQIVLPGVSPYRADISADLQDAPGPRARATIVEIGDLQGVHARDTIDVSGRYLHPEPHNLPVANGRVHIGPGASALFMVSDSSDPYALPSGLIEHGRYRALSRHELAPTETRPDLAACYRVMSNDSSQAATRNGGPTTVLPFERIELLWRYAPDRGRERGALLARPHSSTPTAASFGQHEWQRPTTDSVTIGWGMGSGRRITLQLARDPIGLRGVARPAQVTTEQPAETPATLRRIPCS